MKRTPLKRKSRLRRVSKKKAASDRKAAPARRSYKHEFHMCQCCFQRPATDCHEIARGPAREQAKLEPCAWLALCDYCHNRMSDYSDFPLTRQLALKLVRDPSRFDLQRINELRGRELDAITLADVVRHLEMRE